MPTIDVNIERCKGCERCLDACPQEILGMSQKLNNKGYKFAVMVDEPRCIGCSQCAIACPDVAIEVYVEGAHYQFFQY